MNQKFLLFRLNWKYFKMPVGQTWVIKIVDSSSNLVAREVVFERNIDFLDFPQASSIFSNFIPLVFIIFLPFPFLIFYLPIHTFNCILVIHVQIK